jgi:hypothetical protein
MNYLGYFNPLNAVYAVNDLWAGPAARRYTVRSNSGILYKNPSIEHVYEEASPLVRKSTLGSTSSTKRKRAKRYTVRSSSATPYSSPHIHRFINPSSPSSPTKRRTKRNFYRHQVDDLFHNPRNPPNPETKKRKRSGDSDDDLSGSRQRPASKRRSRKLPASDKLKSSSSSPALDYKNNLSSSSESDDLRYNPEIPSIKTKYSHVDLGKKVFFEYLNEVDAKTEKGEHLVDPDGFLKWLRWKKIKLGLDMKSFWGVKLDIANVKNRLTEREFTDVIAQKAMIDSRFGVDLVTFYVNKISKLIKNKQFTMEACPLYEEAMQFEKYLNNDQMIKVEKSLGRESRELLAAYRAIKRTCNIYIQSKFYTDYGLGF